VQLSLSEAVKVPVVEHLSNSPLVLNDPLRRFRLSRWNYFINDQANHVLAGYWEAAEGYEDLDTADFDEIMVVLAGRLYVTCGGEEIVAEPGDTVIVRQGRPVRIAARECVRAFFVCYPVPDPAGYEAAVRAAMQAQGLA
jgi:uncharacterized cupin superfamily protein